LAKELDQKPDIQHLLLSDAQDLPREDNKRQEPVIDDKKAVVVAAPSMAKPIVRAIFPIPVRYMVSKKQLFSKKVLDQTGDFPVLVWNDLELKEHAWLHVKDVFTVCNRVCVLLCVFYDTRCLGVSTCYPTTEPTGRQSHSPRRNVFHLCAHRLFASSSRVADI
jgi:hypothetical protein